MASPSSVVHQLCRWERKKYSYSGWHRDNLSGSLTYSLVSLIKKARIHVFLYLFAWTPTLLRPFQFTQDSPVLGHRSLEPGVILVVVPSPLSPAGWGCPPCQDWHREGRTSTQGLPSGMQVHLSHICTQFQLLLALACPLNSCPSASW